jgi:hypothetical protein
MGRIRSSLLGQNGPGCLGLPNRQNTSKWASDQGFHLRGRSYACYRGSPTTGF